MVEHASDFLDRSTSIFRDDVAFFVSVRFARETERRGRERRIDRIVVGIEKDSLVSHLSIIF